MKTLKIFLVLVFVLFSGFSIDSMRREAGVTVPVKFDGVIITNPSTATVCTPTGDPYPYFAHARTGWLQGNQSHGGQLITEQSTWTILSCDTDWASMLNTSLIEGINTVANGDSYFYKCTMLTNFKTYEVVLNITFNGGTGRFEGVTGQATLSGVHTESGIPVKGWGSLTFHN
jgi:hypothetical protein